MFDQARLAPATCARAPHLCALLLFFDTDNGTELFTDDEGSELPDAQAAHDEACGAMADLARECMPSEPHPGRDVI